LVIDYPKQSKKVVILKGIKEADGQAEEKQGKWPV
jgi:hypothetical protein